MSYVKTNKMKFVLVSLLMMLSCLASAQEITNSRDSNGFRCSTIVIEGDTIPVMYYDEVRIWGERSYRNPAESRQWERLVRNVKKAYPYAKLAGIKFNEYNSKIADVKSDKVKKAMMKQAEDEIEAQFGKELRDLTFTQGKILLKLIDRETSNSSYEIVKDFRGNFRAFFYQSFARLFGYDLKARYDPLGEDADIERIVLMIESGRL
jgi:Domain of unknown function (DUF4294)